MRADWFGVLALTCLSPVQIVRTYRLLIFNFILAAAMPKGTWALRSATLLSPFVHANVGTDVDYSHVGYSFLA